MPFHRLALLPPLLGLLVYAASLGNGFAGDDTDIIVNFPLLRELRNIPLFFAMQDTLADGIPTGYYRPLGRLVYMLDYQLWGLWPAGYHLVNLALHLLTTWGWCLVVRRLAGDRVALLAATLFCVAPVNVESVAYIIGRNNIQVACLLVFSFYAHLRGEAAGESGRRTLWPWLALLLYGAALFTKEFAVFFPFMLLAYGYLRPDSGSDSGWRRQVKVLSPYLLSAIGYLIIRAMVVGSAASLPLFVSPGTLADTVRSIATYLKLLLWPVELAVTHEIAYGAPLADLAGWLSLLLVLLLLALWPLALRRNRTIAFFLGWFLLFLFPVCGIISFNPVPVAERYLYVASLGAYTVIALAALFLQQRWQRTVLILGGAFLLFFALRTAFRTLDWRDDLTLALSTVKSQPDSPVAYYQLGNAYLSRERHREALEAFSRSVALNPSFPHARMNLARSYHMTGDLDGAIREYLASLEFMPDNPQLLAALADAYYQKGMRAEAAAQLRRQIAINPGDGAARNNLKIIEAELARPGLKR